jgi:predicted Zn-ribbon and HTH transcriptional regulator
MGRTRVPTKLRTGAPREGVVLCPPARMARYGASLETWCEENGERGARLLEEYADTEKIAREVTKGSNHKALWDCADCGHEWRTRVGNRTRNYDRPTGCPACTTPGVQATETHNLKLTCEESEGQLEHLLGQWKHLTKRMEDFTPGSAVKVPWKCGKCGEKWDATINSRTRSENPSGCPGCNPPPPIPGIVATETHNLKLTCEESGGQLAHLLEEWDHPTMRMEDFTPASHEIVPWKCRKCGEKWDARIGRRTRIDRPSGCPGCSNHWTKTGKLIEL